MQLCQGQTIERKDLFPNGEEPEPAKPETPSGTAGDGLPTGGMTISEMEKRLIYRTLEKIDGHRTKAAERLGVSIRTLRNKLNEYNEKQKE